jgi:hypothetical protein
MREPGNSRLIGKFAMAVTRISISCESCRRSWAIVGAATVYERQSIESQPCPACGAYTLCCPEPVDGTPRRPRRGKRSDTRKAEGF